MFVFVHKGAVQRCSRRHEGSRLFYCSRPVPDWFRCFPTITIVVWRSVVSTWSDVLNRRTWLRKIDTAPFSDSIQYTVVVYKLMSGRYLLLHLRTPAIRSSYCLARELLPLLRSQGQLQAGANLLMPVNITSRLVGYLNRYQVFWCTTIPFLVLRVVVAGGCTEGLRQRRQRRVERQTRSLPRFGSLQRNARSSKRV